jgi:ParB-like chromosome segregation protein Spo0J
MVKVSTIKPNPNNPRQIKGEKFDKLKASIESFPRMMSLRPMVVDNDNVLLGGNMRLAAIKALGMKEIPDEWVVRADDLTDEQKREFIVKDNVGFGEWDWDLLANEWDDLPLDDWGLDLPSFEDEADDQGVEAEKEPIECPNCGHQL